MKTRLLASWDRVRSSYWFIPTLMSLGAVALSLVMAAIDSDLDPAWSKGIDFLHASQPEGARALLSVVAGSMIGVAGVTFSITIASVVYASGQYGPRLLINFMRDTGNQITLGTFIATFIYCLTVLRAVRSGFDGSGAFVPQLSILMAFVLALASIAVLIYFIHHVPHSIHVSHVIGGVGRELRERVNRLFPERVGEGRPTAARDEDAVRDALPEGFTALAAAVVAEKTGYLQGIDGESLMEAAVGHDLIVRVVYRPGDFVRHGDVLALAWPPGRVTAAAEEEIRYAFAWGSARSALQDLRFLVNELVEIAARALSPSVCDPFTAMNCIDWLGAGMAALATREVPSPLRHDERGALRVVARATGFAEFVEAAVGQLRPYVAADRNALFHTFHTLANVTPYVRTEDQRQALRVQTSALLEAAQRAGLSLVDGEEAQRRHDVMMQLLDGRMTHRDAAAVFEWVAGTA